MNGIALTTLIMLVLLVAPAAGAEGTPIYKTVDADGNVVFTDQATEGAEEVEVKETATFTGGEFARDYERVRAEPPPGATAPPSYELRILSPVADETVRDNAGNLSIAFEVTPPLASNHVLELVLDGKVVQQVTATAPISLAQVDRGTHQVQLRVVERTSSRTVQEGAATSFTLLRHSIQNPAR